MSRPGKRARAREVYERLRAAYPDARCTLDYETPFELLIATVLAAQCTDARVNVVTKTLFRKFRRPEDYLSAPAEELQEDIRTCGFFRQKAKSIRNIAFNLVDQYGGKVPGTMNELLTLDGVGRKTANVLLGECFGVPGVIVDTHCRRVAKRLGFTAHDDPSKIEQDLMKIWEEPTWTQFSHLLVAHGRATCVARNPRCSQCPVLDLCPFPRSALGKKVAR